MENWKDIPGYEGMYQISDLGRVKALARYVNNPIHGTIFRKEKLMIPCPNMGGYYSFLLSKGGTRKTVLVHRMVAIQFVNNANPILYPDINHKDGNKNNNHYLNLEWSNDSLNGKHAWDTGLKTKRFGKNHWAAKAVTQMDLAGNPISTFGSIKEAGRETGVCDKNINACVLGNRGHRTAGGYKWQYSNL